PHQNPCRGWDSTQPQRIAHSASQGQTGWELRALSDSRFFWGVTWRQDFSLLLFVLFIHFPTICCVSSPSCAVVCGGKLRQRKNVVVVVSLEPLTAFHTPRGLDLADEPTVNQQADRVPRRVFRAAAVQGDGLHAG